MWGLLLQLERDPIAVEDRRMKGEVLMGYFIPVVADKLWECEEENRVQEFLDFTRSLPKDFCIADETEMSIVFKEGFREAFFKKRFDLFKETADGLTLEEFASDNSVRMTKLRESLNSFFDTYVIEGTEWYVSFEEFVRKLEPNEKFYIGALMHYHR